MNSTSGCVKTDIFDDVRNYIMSEKSIKSTYFLDKKYKTYKVYGREHMCYINFLSTDNFISDQDYDDLYKSYGINKIKEYEIGTLKKLGESLSNTSLREKQGKSLPNRSLPNRSLPNISVSNTLLSEKKRKSQQKSHNSLSVKPRTLPVKPISLPVKPRSLPVKPRSLPVKPRSLPVKPRSLPVKPISLHVKPISLHVKPISLSKGGKLITEKGKLKIKNEKEKLKIKKEKEKLKIKKEKEKLKNKKEKEKLKNNKYKNKKGGQISSDIIFDTDTLKFLNGFKRRDALHDFNVKIDDGTVDVIEYQDSDNNTFIKTLSKLNKFLNFDNLYYIFPSDHNRFVSKIPYFQSSVKSVNEDVVSPSSTKSLTDFIKELELPLQYIDDKKVLLTKSTPIEKDACKNIFKDESLEKSFLSPSILFDSIMIDKIKVGKYEREVLNKFPSNTSSDSGKSINCLDYTHEIFNKIGEQNEDTGNLLRFSSAFDYNTSKLFNIVYYEKLGGGYGIAFVFKTYKVNISDFVKKINGYIIQKGGMETSTKRKKSDENQLQSSKEQKKAKKEEEPKSSKKRKASDEQKKSSTKDKKQKTDSDNSKIIILQYTNNPGGIGKYDEIDILKDNTQDLNTNQYIAVSVPMAQYPFSVENIKVTINAYDLIKEKLSFGSFDIFDFFKVTPIPIDKRKSGNRHVSLISLLILDNLFMIKIDDSYDEDHRKKKVIIYNLKSAGDYGKVLTAYYYNKDSICRQKKLGLITNDTLCGLHGILRGNTDVITGAPLLEKSKSEGIRRYLIIYKSEGDLEIDKEYLLNKFKKTFSIKDIDDSSYISLEKILIGLPDIDYNLKIILLLFIKKIDNEYIEYSKLKESPSSTTDISKTKVSSKKVILSNFDEIRIILTDYTFFFIGYENVKIYDEYYKACKIFCGLLYNVNRKREGTRTSTQETTLVENYTELAKNLIYKNIAIYLNTTSYEKSLSNNDLQYISYILLYLNFMNKTIISSDEKAGYTNKHNVIYSLINGIIKIYELLDRFVNLVNNSDIQTINTFKIIDDDVNKDINYLITKKHILDIFKYFTLLGEIIQYYNIYLKEIDITIKGISECGDSILEKKYTEDEISLISENYSKYKSILTNTHQPFIDIYDNFILIVKSYLSKNTTLTLIEKDEMETQIKIIHSMSNIIS